MNNLFEKFKNKNPLEINELFVSACKKGDLEEAKYLLNSKELIVNADINSQWKHGFLFSCVIGNLNIIEYLLTNEHWKEDFEQHYESAVKFACSNGHLEIVKFLLTSDIVKGKEKIIINPGFVSACENGETEIVKYLFANHKHRLDSFSKSNGFTLGYYFKDSLSKACKNGHLENLSYLLDSIDREKKYNPFAYNFKDYIEYLFPIACKNGQLPIIDYFLNSPSITNYINFTVTQTHLELACSTGLVNMAKYFLESSNLNKNLDINANYDEIFIYALKENHNDLMNYLIFDMDIKKTPRIRSILEYQYKNETVHNWFNLRDLQEDLTKELSVNDKTPINKVKL